MTLALVFLVLALLAFVLAAANFPEGRGANLTALGLAPYMLSMIVGTRGL